MKNMLPWLVAASSLHTPPSSLQTPPSSLHTPNITYYYLPPQALLSMFNTHTPQMTKVLAKLPQVTHLSLGAKFYSRSSNKLGGINLWLAGVPGQCCRAVRQAPHTGRWG